MKFLDEKSFNKVTKRIVVLFILIQFFSLVINQGFNIGVSFNFKHQYVELLVVAGSLSVLILAIYLLPLLCIVSYVFWVLLKKQTAFNNTKRPVIFSSFNKSINNQHNRFKLQVIRC